MSASVITVPARTETAPGQWQVQIPARVPPDGPLTLPRVAGDPVGARR